MYVYIPGGAGTNALGQLKAVGLETLHDDDASIEAREILDHGPDGGHGVIIGWSTGPASMIAHRAESQVWHKVVPSGELPAGRAWIGWEKSAPPTPERLARKKQLSGEEVVLKDGKKWLIPIARYLPRLLGYDEGGKVASMIDPLYKPFVEHAFDTLQKFVDEEGEVTVDFEIGLTAVARIMAMNYRISEDVIMRCGLITDQHLWTIPKIVFEAESLLLVLQKKNPSDS